MGIIFKRILFLNVLCLVLLSFKCSDKVDKVIIYRIPINSPAGYPIMYYASVTEERLRQQANLKTYKFENKKQIKALYNAYKGLKKDKLLSVNQLSLRVIVEGYNKKNDLLFKIGLDLCGLYQVDGKAYFVNDHLVDVLEELIPDLEFAECSFEKLIPSETNK